MLGTPVEYLKSSLHAPDIAPEPFIIGLRFLCYLSSSGESCQPLKLSWDILRNFQVHTSAPMSAKEFYHKSPLHVPEIPPEVWITILRHATWDPKFPFPSELTFESIGMSRCASEHLRSFRKVLVSPYILLQ